MSGIVKPPFGTPLKRDHWASQGLIASYLFNENSGRTVYDSSGNENHGQMIGFGAEDTPASGWTAGPHGGAIAFDGINDAASVPNAPGLAPTAEISVIVALKILNSSKNYQVFVEKPYSTASSPYFDYVLGFDLAPKCRFRIDLTQAVSVSSLIAQSDYVIAGTYDGHSINLYINGKLDATTPKTGPINTTGRDLRFGTSTYYATRELAANISAIFLYSRALSPEEISYLAAFPYCMYEQDDSIFSKPFNQNFYRQLLAGGY